MANPTVTIEIREIGSAQVIRNMRRVRQEAGKLVGAKKRLSRQVGNTGKSFKKSGKTIGRFSELMRDLETNAVLALGPLSGVGARIRAIGVLARRGNIALIAFSLALAAVVGAVVLLVAGLIKTRLSLESVEGRLRAVTGSALLAKIELRSLMDISLDLGLNLKALAEGFSTLSAAARGTSLEGEGIRKVFIAISKAAGALRLSAEDTAGIIRALEQALTKGVLRAEEFNQQLGDRLPGAAVLASRAINKTKQEFQAMLVAGEIITEEFLPKLAEELENIFSAEAERNAETLRGSMNRLGTSITILFDIIEARLGVADKFAKFINKAADAIVRLGEFFDTALAKTSRNLKLFEEDILQFELKGILQDSKDKIAKEFTELRGELVKQLSDLQTLVAEQPQFIKDIKKFLDIGEGSGITDLKEAIGEIDAALRKLNEFEVRDLAKITAPSITKLEKAFDKLILKAQAAEKSMRRLSSGDILGAQFEESVGRASQILTKFADNVIVEFARVKGFISQELSDMFADPATKAEAYAEILRTVQGQMGLVVQSAKDFKTVAKIFEETRTPVEKFVAEMEKLELLLEKFKKFPEIVEAIKRKMLEINPVLSAVRDSIRELGRDFVSAIREGASLVDVLINSFGNLLERLLEIAIQLLIIGPLLKALKLPGGSDAPNILGTLLGIGTSIATSGLSTGVSPTGSDIAGTPFAHGTDFTVRGKGGVDKNFVPLELTAGERVQVTPAGGDSGEKMTVINFNFPPGTNVREFRDSQGQLAATVAGVLSSASQSNA